MPYYRKWSENVNPRGFNESCCEGEHVSLYELKEDPNLYNHYLEKTNIPRYPDSVLFSISDICHVTGKNGLDGIIRDGGFRKSPELPGDDKFLWWSLSVSKGDIDNAEKGFLKSAYPYYDADQAFLSKFTTSPAFLDESRYGNFKFNFTLKELLHRYAQQFCHNGPPILRVMDTRIYKQEIMYSVLVHPPHYWRYKCYPRLPREDEDGDVCGYSQGKMWWHCQSPSNAYDHRLEIDEEEGKVWARQLSKQKYYVWDHVTVAFHMQPHWTLRVNRQRLLNSVSVCEIDTKYLSHEPGLSFRKACEVLIKLKASYGQY